MSNIILDLESHLKQTKAGERLFAFAGLLFFPDVDETQCQCSGMLKMTSVLFKDGSGKLCCQFLLDLEQSELREKVEKLFLDLSHQALDLHLGQDFEYLSPVEQMELDDSVWYGLSLTFSFKNMQNCSAGFVRERIVPALEQRLPMRIQELQLWEGDDAADNLGWVNGALKAVVPR